MRGDHENEISGQKIGFKVIMVIMDTNTMEVSDKHLKSCLLPKGKVKDYN